jgi:hypothetical protein
MGPGVFDMRLSPSDEPRGKPPKIIKGRDPVVMFFIVVALGIMTVAVSWQVIRWVCWLFGD